MKNTAMALVKYAVSISKDQDVGLLLRLWVEGDFDAIRKNFPDVPNNILSNEDIVFYNGVKYKAMVGMKACLTADDAKYLIANMIHACHSNACVMNVPMIVTYISSKSGVVYERLCSKSDRIQSGS